MRYVFIVGISLVPIFLSGCRGFPPVAQPDQPITSSINPFPFSRWEGLEADGDSVRLEFTDSQVSFFKRRRGGQCWTSRGTVPFQVEHGQLKTIILDAGNPCLPYEYNGGVVHFPSFSGDWNRWFLVGNFRTETALCP